VNRCNHAVLLCLLTACAAFAADRVKTANGVLESTTAPKDGVRSFKGIPFAAAPVGDLRWKEPQPVKSWTDVRNADQFGARCMQRSGGDYWFRSNGMSEDCLYLNVWTPAKPDSGKLPVLVYIFGGGFTNGDGSEYRYDGESMARRGIVAVTVNYRLGIFGFLSHPDLTKESAHRASGNYGLLDQVAALEWVQKNIAAFGGDPKHVTVAGESAGSISVSALMASPLSKNLMAAAIGESGALISTLPPKPLAVTEKDGVTFSGRAGAASIGDLRALTADKIMELTAPAGGRGGRGAPGTPGAPAPAAPLSFSVNLDGYFLPKTLTQIFEAGEQARIPLLAGSNSAEQGANSVLGQSEPTVENFAAAIHRLYPDNADEVLKVYAPTTPDEVIQAATDLASARFIAHGTWKWAELQMKTGGKPVYRYYYARVRPRYLGMPGETTAAGGAGGGGRGAGPGSVGASGGGRGGRGGGAAAIARGAAHSAEIQYAMGNLDLDNRYAWDADDHKVSETMQSYFANFIKTFNPNGPGQPEWSAYSPKSNYARMHIDVVSKSEPEPDRARYAVLDTIFASQR
jgi:para-nitrobenzyl esterase